jgi:uncharacterized protein YfiM (DUF2279 family)
VRKNLIYIFLLLAVVVNAQDSTLKEFGTIGIPIKKINDSNAFQNNSRKWIVGAGTTAIYATSFIYLNEAWYKGYPRSTFHAFNDAGEWLQMDKIGHVWTAYNTSKATTALWKWAGVNEKNSVFLGSGTSLLYMLSIEYLDGRSSEWGWSWADVVADFSGSILFSVQQLAWKQQKMQLKFSSHKRNYEQSLTDKANNLFGNGLYERLLKDYNAQTYWLSFNINSFLRENNFPNWLNISVGYGAEGMLGGYANIAYDKNGNIIFDRRDISRYRQWYLAPDIDFSKIKTSSKVLRTVLFALNSFKFPAPSLELSNGKLRGHWLHF